MADTLINNDGFTAEEEAMLTEGEDDLGELGAEKPERSETGAKPVSVQTEAAASKPNGKPPDGYVPQSALHEARQEIKDYKARMERMEALFQKSMERSAPAQQQQPVKAAEPEIPAYDQDPLGHQKAVIDKLTRTIADLQGNFQKRTEQEDQNAKSRSTLEQYGQAVAQFKRQAPDYDDAFQYLIDTRNKELAFVHEDPTERSNRIQYEEGYIAAAAMRQGKNPAQVFMEMAKVRGYKGKQAAVEENKLERLANGQKAARSNSGGKAAATDDDVSLEKLAEMDPDSPEYDKAWAKFEKAARRAERR